VIELLVRFIFVGILLGLYYVGLYLSPPQKACLASSLDFKLLLPLVSLVFLEFFVRKFSPLFYSVSGINVQFKPKAMCLEFSILHHRSPYPSNYSYRGLSWVQSDTLTLHCRFSDNSEQVYNVPERFTTVLNSEKSSVVITLRSNPGMPLKRIGSICIRGRRTHFFLAALWIRVNNISLPHFFLIKRTEEV